MQNANKGIGRGLPKTFLRSEAEGNTILTNDPLNQAKKHKHPIHKILKTEVGEAAEATLEGLKCKYCSRIKVDAVLFTCCGLSCCNTCGIKHLSSSICPDCTSRISHDNLVEDRWLRTRIKGILSKKLVDDPVRSGARQEGAPNRPIYMEISEMNRAASEGSSGKANSNNGLISGRNGSSNGQMNSSNGQINGMNGPSSGSDSAQNKSTSGLTTGQSTNGMLNPPSAQDAPVLSEHAYSLGKRTRSVCSSNEISTGDKNSTGNTKSSKGSVPAQTVEGERPRVKVSLKAALGSSVSGATPFVSLKKPTPEPSPEPTPEPIPIATQPNLQRPPFQNIPADVLSTEINSNPVYGNTCLTHTPMNQQTATGVKGFRPFSRVEFDELQHMSQSWMIHKRACLDNRFLNYYGNPLGT
eukprot:Platyproteum_vivax@DN534_c0_g1_i1.p1